MEGYRRALARILHEAFGCERRKHGIFGLAEDVHQGAEAECNQEDPL